ncbi:MAG: type II secretion system F family protein, partial [Candidatus Micrarchaeota archaeon]|nr:type II secretion system F family protein [Candidatus Micrarchaeota archaeon]
AMNALLWGLLFAVLVFALASVLEKNTQYAYLPAAASLVLVTVMFMCVFAAYPGILIKKEAEEIDSHLTYALNDLVMQVAAGTSLTEAMRRVAQGKYGKVSEQFREVIERIMSGESQEQALANVAKKNRSEFMRRVLWQLSTVLHTGASLDVAMKDLIAAIRNYQDNKIKQYSQSLNFYILLYLMAAVVVPSLAILLLTTISVFLSEGGMVNIGRVSLSIEQVIIMAVFTLIACQIAIVEYIRVRRPML